MAPTLIQESTPDAKPIERKREELAGVPVKVVLSDAEVAELAPAIGDNTGSMLLKGATPDHEGDERPDRWPLDAARAELARRWGIDPERDLRRSSRRGPRRASPCAARLAHAAAPGGARVALSMQSA